MMNEPRSVMAGVNVTVGGTAVVHGQLIYLRRVADRRANKPAYYTAVSSCQAVMLLTLPAKPACCHQPATASER